MCVVWRAWQGLHLSAARWVLPLRFRIGSSRFLHGSSTPRRAHLARPIPTATLSLRSRFRAVYLSLSPPPAICTSHTSSRAVAVWAPRDAAPRAHDAPWRLCLLTCMRIVTHAAARRGPSGCPALHGINPPCLFLMRVAAPAAPALPPHSVLVTHGLCCSIPTKRVGAVLRPSI
ncbi:MAG: hypothetical protein J3K34DRAFT_406480 [Monoraphidium minutum]|nr:MAG: hypothetical protein J3K34DRAFT_406480 [Monoraphidium minutum]